MSVAAFQYRCQVEVPAASGLPGDQRQMTLYFGRSVAPDNTAWVALKDAVRAFFNTTPSGGSGAVGSYMGDQSNASASNLVSYLIPTNPGPTGSPVRIDPCAITVGGSSTTTLIPSEVAVVASFNADLTDVPVEVGSTRPQSRRRSRVYIGPLQTGAFTHHATTHEPFVSNAMRGDIVAAAKQFLGTQALAAGWTQKVFSRVEWVTRDVINVSVDDAPDIQRRRGFKATVRTSLHY